MTTDPITEMLNKISNAKAVGKLEVFVPLSNEKYEIAKVISDAGFVGDIKKTVKGKMKVMKITLKYTDGVSPITGFKRVSKPGQRIYVKADEIRKVKGGYGFSVISTSKGIMINKEARKQKLGGEVICEIW